MSGWTYHSNSAEDTAMLAIQLGATLVPGDTVLLTGAIGAGKTHFARSLIQSVLTLPEDVPSPTFTLVQTYDTDIGELWHADLYRLSSVNDVVELGLLDAFATAICLVEWPDRLGPNAPPSALSLSFASGPGDTQRRISAEYSDTGWARTAHD